jgi:hypothetical protein
MPLMLPRTTIKCPNRISPLMVDQPRKRRARSERTISMQLRSKSMRRRRPLMPSTPSSPCSPASTPPLSIGTGSALSETSPY